VTQVTRFFAATFEELLGPMKKLNEMLSLVRRGSWQRMEWEFGGLKPAIIY